MGTKNFIYPPTEDIWNFFFFSTRAECCSYTILRVATITSRSRNFNNAKFANASNFIFFYKITYIVCFIIRERLTIESERKWSSTPIVEYAVAIVESVKHPATVRVHRMSRLRIRTKSWIHGWGTRRTRVRWMTEEPAVTTRRKEKYVAEVGRCSWGGSLLGAISRTYVLQ